MKIINYHTVANIRATYVPEPNYLNYTPYSLYMRVNTLQFSSLRLCGLQVLSHPAIKNRCWNSRHLKVVVQYHFDCNFKSDWSNPINIFQTHGVETSKLTSATVYLSFT